MVGDRVLKGQLARWTDSIEGGLTGLTHMFTHFVDMERDTDT